MFDWIQQIVDMITGFFELVWEIVMFIVDGLLFIISLPIILIQFITDVLGVLPTVIIGVLIGYITVSVLLKLLGREGGT